MSGPNSEYMPFRQRSEPGEVTRDTPVLSHVKQPSRLAMWWARERQNLRVFLGLSPDWMNPDNAPPSLDPTMAPHRFIEMPDLKCCPECGGGRNHAIHKV